MLPIHPSKRQLLQLTFALIAVIIVCMIVTAWRSRRLAQRLTDAGWRVYLLPGCGYCERQMSLLDGFTNYTICAGGNPRSCHGIDQFPLWHNPRTEKQRIGYQDRQSLCEMIKQR